MKKTLIALAAIATIAVAGLAPTTADARCRGWGVAAGVLGGIAAGALIAGAANGAYAAPPYYAPAPVYGPPAYYAAPVCHWERNRYWDGYSWRSRRVRICD
jgi:hypothetical protein